MGKTSTTTTSKKRNAKFDKLIGPTDPKIDHAARERIVTARVSLLLRHSFFGNLATRLALTNADDWLSTAATDGLRLYYNSRFIMMLRPKEVEFLVAHEVLHLVYHHLDRIEGRNPTVWNIAGDYAINADLKRHRVGEFIKTVPCLFEAKYDGKASEFIYDDLMKNATKINMDDLIDQMIDDHMDGQDGEGDGDDEGEGKEGKGKGKRPKMSNEEKERVRQELKQAIINAAQSTEPGSLPAGVDRLVKNFTHPVMPWRDLIQTNLTSSIRTNFSWLRPSRKGWHVDAILPSQTPGEEIDVSIFIDMSGSISLKQAQAFLGEIGGMMSQFDGYRVKVHSFDTQVYNEQDFTSENLDDITTYEPKGGGGTNFDCIYEYLKEHGNVPKRLIVFTDLYCHTFGDPNYCDTTWIIFDNPSGIPPHGTYAHYDNYK